MVGAVTVVDRGEAAAGSSQGNAGWLTPAQSQKTPEHLTAIRCFAGCSRSAGIAVANSRESVWSA